MFELSNVHDAQTTMKAASGRQRVNPPQGYHLHRSGIIRVSEQLLKKDPSEKEEQAAQEMLRRFSVMFPDEGDDAADYTPGNSQLLVW